MESALPLLQPVDGGCPVGGGDCVQLGNFGNELVFIDTSGATLSGTAMPSTTVLQSFPIINARFDFAVGSSSGNFALATLNSLSFAPSPSPPPPSSSPSPSPGFRRCGGGR